MQGLSMILFVFCLLGVAQMVQLKLFSERDCKGSIFELHKELNIPDSRADLGISFAARSVQVVEADSNLSIQFFDGSKMLYSIYTTVAIEGSPLCFNLEENAVKDNVSFDVYSKEHENVSRIEFHHQSLFINLRP